MVIRVYYKGPWVVGQHRGHSTAVEPLGLSIPKPGRCDLAVTVLLKRKEGLVGMDLSVSCWNILIAWSAMPSCLR